MEFKGKTALVVGLARSGVAAAKVLDGLGVRVLVNDIKPEENFKDLVVDLKQNTKVTLCLGMKPNTLISDVDFIIISPGVPINSPFVQKARDLGKEVISEVEMAYRMCKAPIVAITGTNGKTTTTALTGEIMKASGRVTHVVGNIGIPFIEKVPVILPEDVVIAEISSFQLEATQTFKPKISAILNITEDHLNRHGTLENYVNMKSRIFENADSGDYLILNADDPLVSSLGFSTAAKVMFFSRKKKLSRGAWVDNGYLKINIDGNDEYICSIDNISIVGSHNLENALVASLIARIEGVPSEIIASVLNLFSGVEHRMEKVGVINNITFYNDSKGTNPDASIKAIEGMREPTVLIAGGMDKKSDFTAFVEAFNDKISALVLLGETAEQIERTAKKKGFTNIHKTKTIKEAVEKSFQLASPGDNILLSPACASWDMFKDYEERGRKFKEAVQGLRR